MPSLADGQSFRKSRPDVTVHATGQRTGAGMGTATREEEACGGEGSVLKSQGERGTPLGWRRVSLQSTPRLLWLPRRAAAVSHLHACIGRCSPVLSKATSGFHFFTRL